MALAASAAFGVSLGCSAPAESREETGAAESAIFQGHEAGSWAPGIVHVVGTLPGGAGYRHCTGTFITRFDVLTAGHCVQDGNVKATKMEISFGSDWGGDYHTAKRFVMQPDWPANQVVDNDMAILSFDDPIGPADSAIELTTLQMPEGSHANEVVVVAGYGMSNSNPSSVGTKRWAYARIKKIVGDELLFDKLPADQDAAAAFAPACSGDSGGPILRGIGNDHWALLGVVYGGGSNCSGSKGETNYASMVSRQRDFIEKNLTIGSITQP